ncbi:MAG: FHA domain-containing protein [Acidobacteria bacterium]|nr:FHA domain-containing protein [Acidobacteriota bacterium]
MFRSLSRTGIRPIEIGRKLIRAIDAGRTTGADGRTTAPNVFSVHLNENDRSTFGDLEKPLITELVDAAKQYVADEGFSLVGEVTVALVTDASIKAGKCEVQATVSATSGLSGSTSSSLREAERSSEVSPAPAVATSPSGAPAAPSVSAPAAAVTPPTVATPSIPPVPAPATPVAEKKAVLVMGDGTKVAVKPGVMSIGRSAESSLPLNDTNASRKHAEIRSRGDGAKTEWYVADLGSTNGTMLNGVKISGEQKLRHGDALMFGSTPARFEVA